MLEVHQKNKTDFNGKLEQIDIAYARFKSAEQSSGTDPIAAQTRAGITEKEITVPVVISQVDSFVGYLSDVYLSGYPLFPIVSTPDDQIEAEQLEAILDTHSIQAGYARHFLMSFRDGIKYNFMPIEHSWEPLEQYAIMENLLNPTQSAQLKQNTNYLTKIRRLDPYNTVWDTRVDPANVCYDGEFAGYIDIMPRIPLKRFINMYSKSGRLYNLGEINSITGQQTQGNYYYTELPTINEFLRPFKRTTDFDWNAWLNAMPQRAARRTLQAGIYERFVCYARIIPSEFKMYGVPQTNSPQIWKFILINHNKLLYAEKIYSVYDALPLLIGQPLEDGFGLQTQSIGEQQIPMQEAASTLMNIRFNAARRAVSDRALYDPTLINEADVNTTEPAPKIPVRLSGLNEKGFDMAYKQVPYDASGTDAVITDMRNVLEMADRLSGLNGPFQGRFQRGNKSVREWEDTMNFSDNRPRLPALNIEFQVMIPIKEQFKLNIFQHGVAGVFQSFKTGNAYKIDASVLSKIKEKVLSFVVADGYTPKSKIASTDFLGKMLETLAQIPLLAQSWGAALPNMYVHLGRLGGIRGMEQYLPKLPAPQGNTGGSTNIIPNTPQA